MRTSFLFALFFFVGTGIGSFHRSMAGGWNHRLRSRCRGRFALLRLVVLDPVIDSAFLGLLRGILLRRGSARKQQCGGRRGNHESFLLMHAWYTMSPKDCAGSISLLLLFQLVSHA